MHIPVYQSISLVVNTAAFGALNYADNLNDLVSRITGGRVTRNTLAEAVLHQAIGLGLSIAGTHKAVDKYAESIAGITGAQLIGYADQILRGTDDEQFSASVKELLTHTLDKQATAGKIPDEAKEPAINLAQNLINNYIGKQAIHQLLGAYAHDHGWDTLTDRIQNALVPDRDFTYTNRLILAGVGVGTDFLRILVDRAIVESPSFQLKEEFYTKPELKLAAGCLHAYLINDENCTEALTNYTPTKPLVDEPFIRNVAELTTALAAQVHLNAVKVLAKAGNALEQANAKLALQEAEPTAAQDEIDKEVDEFVLVDAIADDEDDFVLVDASDDGMDENKAALVGSSKADTQSKVLLTDLPKQDVDISDFVIMDTNEQIDAKDAQEAYEKAQAGIEKARENAVRFKALSEAIGMVLMTDPDTRNAERIENALNVLLKAIPADFGLKHLLASTLSRTTELPAQSIIGTYVAIPEYGGWDGLEALLINTVEKNLERLENEAVKQAAEEAEKALKLQELAQRRADEYAIQRDKDNPNTQNAAARIPDPQPEQDTAQTGTAAANGLEKSLAQSDPQTDNKERSWVRRAIPTLAVKLAIQHLRPYIDKGDFKHPDVPEYKAVAALLHHNQEALGGNISYVQIARNSALIVAQYMVTRASSGAQSLGSAAVGYASSAVQTGAEVVGTQFQSASNQIMAAGGLANALLSPAVSVATTTGGFVAGLWNRLSPFAAAPDETAVAIPAATRNDTDNNTIAANLLAANT
ncbi:hypothetical protein BOTU111921_01460 [Bordetella tumbae]|uniref:hypothetical protein n=1 Tax=Bordetella tumbae TaxID=1649139 RepID=UPI0039EE87C6